MQITEMNEGLKREVRATVSAVDMEARLIERLVSVKDRIKLNGFRPGKAPMARLRKAYGAEIISEILSDVPYSILAGRGALLPNQKLV